MTAKTRAKPSLHRDSFVAPLARGTRTLPGAVVGLRLLKHTAGPLCGSLKDDTKPKKITLTTTRL